MNIARDLPLKIAGMVVSMISKPAMHINIVNIVVLKNHTNSLGDGEGEMR